MKLLVLTITTALTFHATLSHASDESLESIASRGATQKIVLTKPSSAPTASVILMAGGHGKLDVSKSSGKVRFGWGGKNNLVRTREMYADQGFLVATMDSPTDRGKMNAIWRMSEAHVEDIGAVTKYLKQMANVPVWVIGTSKGSFSAANAGISLKESINGIVLTSSITKSKSGWKIYDDYPNGIANMNLANVTVPVLIVSHEDDQCALTPASDISMLASQFTASVKVEKSIISGGDAPKSGPCKALSAHGFLGVEADVVKKIASFIKSN